MLENNVGKTSENPKHLAKTGKPWKISKYFGENLKILENSSAKHRKIW